MHGIEVGTKHGEGEVVMAAHGLAGDHFLADLVKLLHAALLDVEGIRHPRQLQIEAG